MFKIIKDNKIIGVSEETPVLLDDYDMVEDTDHSVNEFIHVDGEYVLKTDDKAIRQEKDQRITELKQLLAEADYWGQKYLDGEYTEEEWAEKVAQRKAWREEIRSLEEY